MKSFIFWQRWLFYSSLSFALFGIVLAIYGNNPLFLGYNSTVAEALWHQHQLPSSAETFRTFVSGPLGATIACCYILLAYMAWFPFRNRERWARNAIAVAFVIWAAFDSAVSLYTGVYFQVYLINTISILQKALPLIFTWKYFT